jgi:hypothetical protein
VISGLFDKVLTSKRGVIPNFNWTRAAKSDMMARCFFNKEHHFNTPRLEKNGGVRRREVSVPGLSCSSKSMILLYQRRSEKYLLLTMMMDEKSEDTPFNREHITEDLVHKAERSLLFVLVLLSIGRFVRHGFFWTGRSSKQMMRCQFELLLLLPTILIAPDLFLRSHDVVCWTRCRMLACCMGRSFVLAREPL